MSCAALAGCQNGTLVLSTADAPVDQASEVLVQFTEVDLTRSDGTTKTFTFSPARSVDFLSLAAGTATRLLDQVQVPSGDYQGLTLKIAAGQNAADSFLVLTTGGKLALFLADDSDPGLTINRPFTVDRRKQLALTVDFDLRKSILKPAATGTPYRLKPTLRLVKDDNAGQIAGSVAATTVTGTSGCTPAVYVYTGSGVTPDDVGPTAAQPVASAPARLNTITGNYDYRIAFLDAGDYTAAFTCDAAADDPETDDAISFTAAPGKVTVSAGQTTLQNF